MQDVCRLAALAALCFGLSLAGCSSGHCNQNADCGSGQVCGTNGSCAKPGICDPGVTSCTNAGQCPSQNDCVNSCCTAITGCATSADCADAARPHCDTATKTCKTCAANNECPVGRVCTPTGRCESSCDPTKNGADCPTAKNKCHVTTNGAICGECAVSADCPGERPTCNDSGICVGCNSNADCGGTTPGCNVATHVCQVCVDASNSNGTNASCKAPTPACKSAACVACNPTLNDASSGQNGACSDATKRVCDTTNNCVGCTATSQCIVGQLCDPGTHSCKLPQLTGICVGRVVQRSVGLAGLNPAQFSGHSLRAGFATAAAKAGKPVHSIIKQTRHASAAMLGRYIRDAELFKDNPSQGLGL